jgi:hypothetical protein
MMTTLDLYCKYKGWQGGTIHQAKQDFSSLPSREKFDFVSILKENKQDCSDYYDQFPWFFNTAFQDTREYHTLQILQRFYGDNNPMKMDKRHEGKEYND